MVQYISLKQPSERLNIVSKNTSLGSRTIGYYAVVCGEDDQPSPAKTAIAAIKELLGIVGEVK